MKLGISLGKTINTGNYENIKIDVNMERNVPENANVDEEYEKIYTEITEYLEGIEADMSLKKKGKLR